MTTIKMVSSPIRQIFSRYSVAVSRLLDFRGNQSVSSISWRNEMEKARSKYHHTAAWVAIIFDPIFAITDYFNIPASWKHLLMIRLSVSLITMVTLLLRKKYNLPSFVIVVVPFLLISLQNAYTYNLIGTEDLIGHNLNYIALFIGAAMFLAWEWYYSLGVIILSATATAVSIYTNNDITSAEFFVKGGLLLGAISIFMLVLIRARYDFTVKEIKARLELQASKEEIQAQNEALHAQEEVIREVNENLEKLVHERTLELQRKNKALEEYAFINAHKLRAPVASILGLVNLMKKADLKEDDKIMLAHLEQSASNLDSVVSSITKAIERGDMKY